MCMFVVCNGKMHICDRKFVVRCFCCCCLLLLLCCCIPFTERVDVIYTPFHWNTSVQSHFPWVNYFSLFVFRIPFSASFFSKTEFFSIVLYRNKSLIVLHKWLCAFSEITTLGEKIDPAQQQQCMFTFKNYEIVNENHSEYQHN